jgi:interleukin-1 receptor-associated kinase 1
MVLWYAHCLVRYDDTAFFGTADTSPMQRCSLPTPINFSDPVSQGTACQRLVERMLPTGVASALRFAIDTEVVTSNTTLHGLAQCTEDLLAEECRWCLALHTAWLAGCCTDMADVRLNGPSCYLRYEFMGFIPSTPPSMTPLLPLFPVSVPGTPSGRKKARIYILAGTLRTLEMLCFVLGAFMCYKKKHHCSLPLMPWKRDTPTIETFLRQQYPRRYSYSQVKQMTKSFAHKLGQGGNGVVYKGSLPDGCELAVKMLKDNRDIDDAQGQQQRRHTAGILLPGKIKKGSHLRVHAQWFPRMVQFWASH